MELHIYFCLYQFVGILCVKGTIFDKWNVSWKTFHVIYCTICQRSTTFDFLSTEIFMINKILSVTDDLSSRHVKFHTETESRKCAFTNSEKVYMFSCFMFCNKNSVNASNTYFNRRQSTVSTSISLNIIYENMELS